MPTRLTAMTHGGGCACKLSAAELTAALDTLASHPAVTHPRLMVDLGTSDDAGVWRLNDDVALIHTVDFFTPMVDDPYDWGRIAAANALSDVYAMGGNPTTALQLVGWPRDALGSGDLPLVIRGGADVMYEAGCVIAGGHSIDSPEPTYGFAVNGTVHPDRVITNAGARPGDVLILTKPLGVGIATAAIKRGVAPAGVLADAVASMTTLNAGAWRVMRAARVNAATDVTGFGLLGHLREMIVASEVAARVNVSSIPILPGVEELAGTGVYSGGTERNLAAAQTYTDFGDTPEPTRVVMADAQTSGGLLIAVPPARSDQILDALDGSVGPQARAIGHVVEGPARIYAV